MDAKPPDDKETGHERGASEFGSFSSTSPMRASALTRSATQLDSAPCHAGARLFVRAQFPVRE
jgi:hypothetical protein